ncbi:hypothetical protein ACFV6F_09280 [Kitasatospora phosalacinea]|uniref:hypothetical protein n=1 Tax=Kitasatospora phosalacinea TaxID=2065 RepID=UPI003649CB12
MSLEEKSPAPAPAPAPVASFSRRSVLRSAAVGVGAAVVAVGVAQSPTATAAEPAPRPAAEPAAEPAGTHVLTAVGLGASTYDPPLDTTERLTTTKAHVTYSQACDAPNQLLVLAADDYTAERTMSCTGKPVWHSAGGTLTWSDLSTSDYTIDIATAGGDKVDGHGVASMTGTITSGHFAGARVTRQSQRAAAGVAACLSGLPTATSQGQSLLEIIQPG